MTVSIFLQVILGLAVVYLLMCMLASGLQEFVSRALNQRGHYLRENLQSLLPDRWVYLRVINHPVVSGLYRDVPGRGVPPSYIPARNFAQALVDVLVCRHQTTTGSPTYDLKGARQAVQDARDKDLAAGHALFPVFARASNMEEALIGVEKWFDSSTARLSGWYKARTQKLLFIIGFAVAVGLNVDSIAIAIELSGSESLRQAATQLAERQTQSAAVNEDLQAARAELAQLRQAGLPIGYACLGTVNRGAEQQASVTALSLTALSDRCRTAFAGTGVGDWLLKLVGWLITALATSLGGPFWFDAINRFINLRSAGTRPSA